MGGQQGNGNVMGGRYTHGYHSSVLRSHSNRTVENSAAYLAAALQPGVKLLDVGSGAGTITADMAARVAPGRVVALELTEESCALTQAEVARHGLGNVHCVVGDVHALDFPDGHFDIVHAHQVLQHVGDPVQALREMKRVCRPGGLVAARDADYAGFIWYPLLGELDEWLGWYQRAARANGGEPNAGRFLLHWAQRAGFGQIECSSSTWCLATPEARGWWGGMWADRILHSRIGAQLLEQNWATQADLQRISDAWRRWMAAEDGWMSIVHGEILCRA
ncbi:class I SAM-dependent methyltransferase [Castellaniella sp.]|uniref:class I SAM-dependent methyltransferase n=1 Tax=Castellaniella sp. TaxID=1955812 RepID=UPI00355E3035